MAPRVCQSPEGHTLPQASTVGQCDPTRPRGNPTKRNPSYKQTFYCRNDNDKHSLMQQPLGLVLENDNVYILSQNG